MVNVDSIFSAVDKFIDSRLEMIVGGNPLTSLMQPFIKRGIKKYVDNQTCNMKEYLSFIADDNGNIDIDSVIQELTCRINDMDPVTMNNKTIGDIVIGNGKISFELPAMLGMPSKHLSFTTEDLNDFKSMVIEKHNGVAN